MTDTPLVDVYSLGHGGRSSDDLIDCLRSFEIRILVDVRQWPTSRHHPHFNREELEPALISGGFLYRWLGRELGGFRTGGYQEHMKTAIFKEGLDRLDAIAREAPTTLLCAEKDPAGCHRRFIARSLSERGFEVHHIIEPGRVLLPGERPEDQGTLFPL